MSKTMTDLPAAVDWADRMLRAACTAVDLEPSGAELIKFTNNAVYALRSTAVVVRIPGSAAVNERVSKVVTVARWLAEHDMPSVRLIEDLPQPVRIGDRYVTFWHRVANCSTARPPDGDDLARLLRQFHELPPPPAALPQWAPLTPIRQRIEADNGVLSTDERDFLRFRCDEISSLLDTFAPSLPVGPIHGDGFIGNLIPNATGPVLCDFDSVAHGPREWDLTPVAVGHLRFAYPADYHRQVAETYGIDILHLPQFAVLRQVRELQLVTSVLPTLRANPTLLDQWRHRFTSYRDDDLTVKWAPYQ